MNTSVYKLPVRLKDLAVQVNVPVKELVKLFAEIGLSVKNRPSTRITPEEIGAVLPKVRIFLQSIHPVSRKTQQKIEKAGKKNKKGAIQSKLKLEILKSTDGFGTKQPKQKKRKNNFKPKKIVIISTPMKG